MSHLSIKFISAFLMITTLSGLFIMSHADSATDINEERLTVNVLAIESQSAFEVTRFFPAVAEAQQSVAISSEIPGKITEIFVDDGDQIIAGQPLFVLDTQLLKTQHASFKARIASIKPELTLAQKRLERQLNLKQQSFSSEDNIDALEANINSLEANINSLEAQIEDLAIRIEKSTIYAPFAAGIQHRLFDEGAVVNAGMPVLELVGNFISEITTGLPSDYIDNLNPNQTYTAYDGNREIPVKLTRVMPEINPVTRTQGAKFELLSANDITASAYLKLAIGTEYQQQGFWLPNSALMEGQRGVWEVFVVSDNQRVKKYSVEIIYPSNPMSYVKSALPDGSRVVIDGVHRLAQDIPVVAKLVDRRPTNVDF